MQTLTLNDGTELAGTIMRDGSGSTIFVYLTGVSLAEGFGLFADPQKTCRITAEDHGHEFVYEGYTQLWAVNNEFGNCNITMKRGAE